MKKDKLNEYICSIFLCIMLFFDLFVSNIFYNKYMLAIFLLIYFIIISIYIKGKKVNSLNHKKVIFMVIMFSVIYILLLYIIGIFVGFYRNSIFFGIKEFFTRILPISVILVLCELIRNKFVTKKNIKSTIIITMALVLVDVLMTINIYNVFNLETILTLIGYVFLSSISINVLCNYIVNRHGYVPNIIYRLITTLYIYILPIIPDIYLFFQAVFRIIYPYIVYLILDYTFTINNFKLSVKNKKTNVIMLLIGIIFTFSLVLLISCKYRFGLMVVGSSSMAGSINKGDAIIFEQYKKQELEEGQVIIFNKDDIQTIHRINDIQILNGEKIYYTKGDNNQQRDDGYRIDNDIIGIVRFRVLYIGWPTVWINEAFNT